MAKITIGGMGTASIEHMTLKTHTLLLETEKIFCVQKYTKVLLKYAKYARTASVLMHSMKNMRVLKKYMIKFLTK